MRLKVIEEITYTCTPGKYLAKITDVTEETLENGSDVIRICFRFKDREKNPVQLTAIFSQSLRVNSRLYRLIEEIGYELEVGDEFDTDDLIGEKIYIYVENKRKGKKEYSNIVRYSNYYSKEEN